MRFPVLTRIHLHGKCVFSAANSGKYLVLQSKNTNEQKENTMFTFR